MKDIKPYHQMTRAEQVAARIAQNKLIDGAAKVTIEREACRKAVKRAINSRKALKELVNHVAKEDPQGTAELLRRIAPLVTFRTVRGIL